MSIRTEDPSAFTNTRTLRFYLRGQYHEVTYWRGKKDGTGAYDAAGLDELDRLAQHSDALQRWEKKRAAAEKAGKPVPEKPAPEKLDPLLYDALYTIQEEIKKKKPGYELRLISLHRTKERQDELRRQGAPAAKNSDHVNGSAADILPSDGVSLDTIQGVAGKVYKDMKIADWQKKHKVRGPVDVENHNGHVHVGMRTRREHHPETALARFEAPAPVVLAVAAPEDDFADLRNSNHDDFAVLRTDHAGESLEGVLRAGVSPAPATPAAQAASAPAPAPAAPAPVAPAKAAAEGGGSWWPEVLTRKYWTGDKLPAPIAAAPVAQPKPAAPPAPAAVPVAAPVVSAQAPAAFGIADAPADMGIVGQGGGGLTRSIAAAWPPPQAAVAAAPAAAPPPVVPQPAQLPAAAAAATLPEVKVAALTRGAGVATESDASAGAPAAGSVASEARAGDDDGKRKQAAQLAEYEKIWKTDPDRKAQLDTGKGVSANTSPTFDPNRYLYRSYEFTNPDGSKRRLTIPVNKDLASNLHIHVPDRLKDTPSGSAFLIVHAPQGGPNQEGYYRNNDYGSAATIHGIGSAHGGSFPYHYFLWGAQGGKHTFHEPRKAEKDSVANDGELNKDSITLSIYGNFTKSSPPTAQRLIAATEYANLMTARYADEGVELRIGGHGDLKSRECPGFDVATVFGTDAFGRRNPAREQLGDPQVLARRTREYLVSHKNMPIVARDWDKLSDSKKLGYMDGYLKDQENGAFSEKARMKEAAEVYQRMRLPSDPPTLDKYPDPKKFANVWVPRHMTHEYWNGTRGPAPPTLLAKYTAKEGVGGGNGKYRVTSLGFAAVDASLGVSVAEATRRADVGQEGGLPMAARSLVDGMLGFGARLIGQGGADGQAVKDGFEGRYGKPQGLGVKPEPEEAGDGKDKGRKGKKRADASGAHRGALQPVKLAEAPAPRPGAVKPEEDKKQGVAATPAPAASAAAGKKKPEESYKDRAKELMAENPSPRPAAVA